MLFENVSFSINPADRIAIVGPNSAGKSTLLLLLAGQLDPTSGDVVRRRPLLTAVADQEASFEVSSTLFDFVIGALDSLAPLRTAIRRLEGQLSDPHCACEYASRINEYQERGGYLREHARCFDRRGSSMVSSLVQAPTVSYGDSSGLPHSSWEPQTEADHAAVREQLERVLATQLFRNSKRYTGFLRFVVCEALAGRADQIKERTLGTDVFGRSPDYDPAENHVVRTAASEVRRRITQYYADAGHEQELRIALPPGSYAPRFYLPNTTVNEALPPVVQESRFRTLSDGRTWLAVGLALLLSVSVLFAALYRKPASTTALDQFWQPVLETSTSVIVSIGQGGDMTGVRPPPGIPERLLSTEAEQSPHDPTGPPLSISGLAWLRCERVNMADALTGWRICSYLQYRGRSAKLQGECGTDYSDLRSGPAVLIGAINNAWTRRLMGQLRYTFDIDRANFVMRIRDSQDPSRKDWKVDGKLPNSQMTEDYAIVSRVLDPSTERMVVVAGGLTKYGTIAAGEFLTDGKHLAAFSQQAPKGWEHQNVQVVLATKVINGQSGPPQVVASSYR